MDLKIVPPVASDPVLAEISALIEARRLHEAMARSLALLGSPGHHFAGLVFFGRASLLAGRAAEALPYVERAARLLPDSAEARKLLGLCLLRAGRPAEAAAELTLAMDRDPDDVDLASSRLLALMRSGQGNLALSAVDELVRRGRPEALAARILGQAASTLGVPGVVWAETPPALAGWVSFRPGPGRVVGVEVALGGRTVALAPVSGAERGFRLEPPPALHGQRLTVRLAGGGPELLGSPLVVGQTGRAEPLAFFDPPGPRPDRLSGFAADPADPASPVALRLWDDQGRAIDILAEEPRCDAASGQGFGFVLDWPFDPRGPAVVLARGALIESGQELAGSPRRLCDPARCPGLSALFANWLLRVATSPGAPPPWPRALADGRFAAFVRERLAALHGGGPA